MRFSTVSAVLAAAGLASAQIQDIPPCALQCLLSSTPASGCGATDYVCQCTTGQQIIAKMSIACLCKSTCTPAELEQTNKATNGICVSALSAVSSSYKPVSYPTNECAILAGSTSSASGSKTSVSSSAATTVTSSSVSSVATSSTGTVSGKKTTVVSSAPSTVAKTSTSSTAASSAASSPASSSASKSAASTASPAGAAMVTMAPQLLLGGLAAAAALL